MDFVLLTGPEIEGAVVEWYGDVPKSPEIIDAIVNDVHLAAFSKDDIRAAPLGRLCKDFDIGGGALLKRGAVALAFSNGTTLLQLPDPPA